LEGTPLSPELFAVGVPALIALGNACAKPNGRGFDRCQSLLFGNTQAKVNVQDQHGKVVLTRWTRIGLSFAFRSYCIRIGLQQQALCKLDCRCGARFSRDEQKALRSRILFQRSEASST